MRPVVIRPWAVVVGLWPVVGWLRPVVSWLRPVVVWLGPVGPLGPVVWPLGPVVWPVRPVWPVGRLPVAATVWPRRRVIAIPSSAKPQQLAHSVQVPPAPLGLVSVEDGLGQEDTTDSKA